MPVSFDFENSGHFVQRYTIGPGSVSNTADGVKFTVSVVSGGASKVLFGNADLTSAPIYLNDSGSIDRFTLRFESTLATLNDTLSGTISNPVKIAWNGGGLGPVRIEFLTRGGGTTGTNTVDAAVAGTAALIHAAVTGLRFTTSAANHIYVAHKITLTSLSANALRCFLGGTGIATPTGDVPAERLAPGDIVLTADGRAVPVQWVGRQPVNVRLSHPAKVNPICITAGALADGVPARDLFVSADHALYVDGMLINAGALVNGSSIYQVRNMPLDGFTYYHIETDAHELLLAEGVAAETFVDYAGRDSFVNGDERAGAAPIREMDLPRISAARLVPADIRDRLAARAGLTRAA